LILKNYFDIPNLTIAWERTIRDSNRDVKDYAGIELFESNIENNLQYLSELLTAGEYKPSRPAKFYEPKATGTQRAKTILCIEDAIVYQCICDTIAFRAYDTTEKYENFVFGSVLNKEVKLGVELLTIENPRFFFFELWMSKWSEFAESVNAEVDDRSMTYKLETDITGFFDCIPHSKLLQLLYKKFDVDPAVLDLFSECLNTWSGTSESATPGVGIPQGPQASFFIANVYLGDIDEKMVSRGLSYYRYMDDFRIYSSSENELIEVLVEIDKFLKSNGLSINSKKTLIEKLDEDREKEKIDNADIMAYLAIAFEEEVELKIDKTESDSIDQIDLTEQFGGASQGDFYFTRDFEFSSDEDAKKYLEKEFDILDNFIWSKIKKVGDSVEFIDEESITKDLRKHQKDWLKIGFEYRSLLTLSESLEFDYKQNPAYIDVWFLLSRKFIAKANQFNWILAKYEANSSLKDKLLSHIEKFRLYEWIQHQFIVTLAISQELTTEELRNCFKKLKATDSLYVKLAYYRLLILQVEPNHQLYSTVKHSIELEKNTFLKTTLLHYYHKKNLGQLSKYDIAKTIGLL
jgi:hypothetical protein